MDDPGGDFYLKSLNSLRSDYPGPNFGLLNHTSKFVALLICVEALFLNAFGLADPFVFFTALTALRRENGCKRKKCTPILMCSCVFKICVSKQKMGL